MSNLIDIQSQIEKLKKQASEIRAREFDKTVKEIVAQMRAFGITPKDLQSVASRAVKSKAKGAARSPRSGPKGKSSVTVAAKYRGPGGETWSGRGLTPRWLAALVAEGHKKEDFVIQG